MKNKRFLRFVKYDNKIQKSFIQNPHNPRYYEHLQMSKGKFKRPKPTLINRFGSFTFIVNNFCCQKLYLYTTNPRDEELLRLTINDSLP